MFKHHTDNIAAMFPLKDYLKVLLISSPVKLGEPQTTTAASKDVCRGCSVMPRYLLRESITNHGRNYSYHHQFQQLLGSVYWYSFRSAVWTVCKVPFRHFNWFRMFFLQFLKVFKINKSILSLVTEEVFTGVKLGNLELGCWKLFSSHSSHYFLHCSCSLLAFALAVCEKKKWEEYHGNLGQVLDSHHGRCCD